MNPYLDEDFMNRLERMELATRRVRAGRNSGDRRSPHKGNAVEFADFRSYCPGDDLRYIDWNGYARSEKLFVKQYLEEQDLLVNIFIDASASMDWGDPPKFRLALQLSAAFAWLALAGYDRVALAGCKQQLDHYLPAVRGRGSQQQVGDFLASIPTGGMSDLNRSLRDFGPRCQGAGLSLVISDLLLPGGFQDGLSFLQYLGQEIVLIQVLSPDEIDPVFSGDVRLVDRESGETREITAGPGLLKAYRRRLQEFTGEIRHFCHRRGISFLQVSSEQPPEEIILRHLTRAGVLK